MIAVWGSINLDLIFALPRLPAAGETVLGPALRMEPGGKGANQAVAAARDGASVLMAGAVGRDALAAPALAGLRSAGVDLSRVAEVDGATGCAAICTDTAGQNQIAVASGANRAVRQSQLEPALLRPGTTILLQMECDPEELAVLIRRARARSARTVLNLAPAGPLPTEVLRTVDVLVANEGEAAWLAAQLGAAPDAASLRAALGCAVVRTRGADGAEYAHGGHAGWTPAFPVAALDTTAAGDCFTGVLAAALDRGQSWPDAVRRASAAAAICCTRPGSQGSLPLAAETDALLEEGLP